MSGTSGAIGAKGAPTNGVATAGFAMRQTAGSSCGRHACWRGLLYFFGGGVGGDVRLSISIVVVAVVVAILFVGDALVAAKTTDFVDVLEQRPHKH